MTSRRAAAGPLEAFVLHQYDWSETSLILDLFTRERGRLAVAAKGAKRPYSQLRGVLLPFQRLRVQLGKTPADDSAEVHNLRSAEWAGGPPMLQAASMFSGLYLNELLMKLLARQDPHPALFDAYGATLPLLGSSDDGGTQATLRAFELVLLRELGLLPDLSVVTLAAEPLEPQRRYALLPEGGVAPAGPAEPGLQGEALVRLEAALGHGSVAALHAACLPVAAPLRGPLRALLHYHLGSAPLRTRQVLIASQKLLAVSSRRAPDALAETFPEAELPPAPEPTMAAAADRSPSPRQGTSRPRP